MTSLSARGWGHQHPGRHRPALVGVDFHISSGEKVLLLGPSGSGKSTLLAGLAGVLETEGSQEFGALRVGAQDPRQARGQVGYMQQDPETQVILPRIGDDVAFGAENLCVAPEEIRYRVSQALNDVGLDLSWEHPSNALSGGQKQRLALAGILAMGPQAILLDEPTANLDPPGVADVRDAILANVAQRNTTLMVVEHRVDMWIEHMDRVLVLDAAGRLVADGSPAQVLAEQQDSLADQGIWVPGWQPPDSLHRRESVKETAESEILMYSRQLAVGRQNSEPVQSGIELELVAGKALAITGNNGSGKTTLALTLGGLLQPIAGELSAQEGLAQGKSSRPWEWKSRDLISRIGTVFQEPEHQFVTGSVRAELDFGLRILGDHATENHKKKVEQLLEELGLSELADANPYTLSGGQKRRLSVASTLVSSPRVLILDEPTFGQDTRTWTVLLRLLEEELRQGCAVVMVTHDELFRQILAGRHYEL